VQGHFFKVAAAVSFVVCVITAVLWVRGIIEIETFGYSRRAHVEGWSTYADDSVLSRSGELAYIHSVDRRPDGPFRPPVREQAGFERLHGTHSVNESYYNHVIGRRWWLAGVGWGAVDERSPASNYSARAISVPSWVLTMLTAILPAVWVRMLVRRHRRRQRGLCPTCGYNLAGNARGVCPECGTTIKAS